MVVTACIFISLEAEYTEDSHLILVGMVAQLSDQTKLLQQNKANFAWKIRFIGPAHLHLVVTLRLISLM